MRDERAAQAGFVDLTVRFDELLDEESLAVLAIVLAVSLEFGFGFAKTVSWWAGLIAGPSSLTLLVSLFRWGRSRRLLIRATRWIVGQRSARGGA